MSVSSTINRQAYSGNGTTTEFTVPFYFLAPGELLVILRDANGGETTLVENAVYTVTGAGNENGGMVISTTAPATGETLVILRNVPPTQGEDFVPGGDFPPEAFEQGLDRLTMMEQQIREILDRVPQLALPHRGRSAGFSRRSRPEVWLFGRGHHPAADGG